MRRALRTGLFIGTLLGMSACAAAGPYEGAASGPYGGVEAGRSR